MAGLLENHRRIVRALALSVAAFVIPLAGAVAVPGEEYVGDGAPAQPDAGGSLHRYAGVVRRYRLPAPTAAERKASAAPAGGPLRIGFGRSFQVLTGTVPDSRDLDWRRAPDGGAVARLEVVSPEARGLRAQLSFTAVPPGAAVRAYEPGASTAGGAALRIEPLREPAAGPAWTPTLCGPVLGLEVYLPPGVAAEAVRFTVPRLSHLGRCPAAGLGDRHGAGSVQVGNQGS